jgi:UDP-GlcNAc3NAcA epimerase
MVMLEMNAALLTTDSGGVQKEAFFYQVPCVTLRDETEWVELVESGWNRLLPPLPGIELAPAILAAIGTRGITINLFGDGKASKKIADTLADTQ